jgi:hypothetical protein
LVVYFLLLLTAALGAVSWLVYQTAAAALHERLNPTPAQTRSSWEPDSWNLKEEAVARQWMPPS